MKPCLPLSSKMASCYGFSYGEIITRVSCPRCPFSLIPRKYIWELGRGVADFIGNTEAKCLCLCPTHQDNTAHFFWRTRNLQCGATFPCWWGKWHSLQQLRGGTANLSKPILGLVPGVGQTPLLTAHSHPCRMWWQGSGSSLAHQLPLLFFILGLNIPGGGSQSQLQFWDVFLVFSSTNSALIFTTTLFMKLNMWKNQQASAFPDCDSHMLWWHMCRAHLFVHHAGGQMRD